MDRGDLKLSRLEERGAGQGILRERSCGLVLFYNAVLTLLICSHKHLRIFLGNYVQKQTLLHPLHSNLSLTFLCFDLILISLLMTLPDLLKTICLSSSFLLTLILLLSLTSSAVKGVFR